MRDERRGWCADALAGTPSPCAPALLEPLNRLHAVNGKQWDAEDRVRQAGDSDVPAIKRQIDELNGLRHELIEQVDRVFDGWWGDTCTAPPLTESIGSALDRLSVLTLRIAHTRALLGAEDDGSIAVLRRQREDLVQAIVVACEDLRSGRRRAPRPERMKLYGKSRK
ncbi:DUF4254 domain-containing protein [Sciscionella marina]|uniref:DUF4254 domain-containing protein n=1 Tax=Sciscionella marina TaxID=508770 RepID=UPI0009FC3208